ncbi:MAG: valine--tRNA ligase [Candidatus Magasanikbacteria bacterium]
MDKRFNHEELEKNIYKAWENSGYFNPDKCVEDEIASENADTFSMILPPPNVTGTLHMGHAEMLAIEDILTRYHRMTGKKTLWIPGTDHAAIATQSKVEKKLHEEGGKTRYDLGRDKFLEKVQEFAKDSQETIITQTKKIGASLDWSRQAYTLDKERNKAVKTAFKEMYEEGLIYRADRVINWDPKGQTVVSDDEVEYEEVEGKLYTFKYSEDFPFAISTTRPETKLGDTAVAVHPEDERYSEYVGKEYQIKFLGKERTIEVVADEKIDPEFGTGAVGITPAHSHDDYDIARRHNLELDQIINEQGELMTGEEIGVKGKSTQRAREIIVDELKDRGLMEKVEEIEQSIGKAERSGGVIEPLPKLQWFIDVEKKFKLGPNSINGVESDEKVSLKELMQKVVENSQIDILPERFEKIYFHWIDNLRDWCISRQIWFGHRIPVWYCQEPEGKTQAEENSDSEQAQFRKSKLKENKESKCLEPIVAVEEPKSCPHCGGQVRQDLDTLDTWFSSGLWTFSTLGWPSETEDLQNFHPTNVLETGYDILFFWVARMILMSTFLLGEVPFKNVYLHGMVLDSQGDKMSKSKGNIIDPVDMIEKYGADATRFSLIIGTGPGSDVNISEEKVESYHKLTTKIWNVARFLNMNKKEVGDIEIEGEDQKIFEKFQEKKRKVGENIENYEFHLGAENGYHFFWDDFANGVLEDVKPRMFSDDTTESKKAYKVLSKSFLECLKMLHPFIPYVTEEIYQRLELGEEEFLMVEEW